MHTSSTFTLFTAFFVVYGLRYKVTGIEFQASSVLSYDLKCGDKNATKNREGISRDEKVEGLFLDYEEYAQCPKRTAERCNENGIKGYKPVVIT